MAKKQRAKLPAILWKRLFQEAEGKCPFCDEEAAESLEIHHIDGNPANNAMENLILVCANCHSKITRDTLTEAEVRIKKCQIVRPAHRSLGAISSADQLHVGHNPFTENSSLRPEDFRLPPVRLNPEDM